MFIFKTGFYPFGIVLTEKYLICRWSSIVGRRVSITVKQITTFVIFSCAMRSRLMCRGTMIEHKNFAVIAITHKHLIKLSIACYRIKMKLVGVWHGGVINVNELTVLRYNTIIVF